MPKEADIQKVQYLNETILLIRQEGYWKHWWRNDEFEFWDGHFYANQEEALDQIKDVINRVTAVRAISGLLEEWVNMDDISRQEMFSLKLSLMRFLPLN